MRLTHRLIARDIRISGTSETHIVHAALTRRVSRIRIRRIAVKILYVYELFCTSVRQVGTGFGNFYWNWRYSRTGVVNCRTGIVDGRTATFNCRTGVVDGRTATFDCRTGVVDGMTGIVVDYRTWVVSSWRWWTVTVSFSY